MIEVCCECNRVLQRGWKHWTRDSLNFYCERCGNSGDGHWRREEIEPDPETPLPQREARITYSEMNKRMTAAMDRMEDACKVHGGLPFYAEKAG